MQRRLDLSLKTNFISPKPKKGKLPFASSCVAMLCSDKKMSCSMYWAFCRKYVADKFESDSCDFFKTILFSTQFLNTGFKIGNYLFETVRVFRKRRGFSFRMASHAVVAFLLKWVRYPHLNLSDCAYFKKYLLFFFFGKFLSVWILAWISFLCFWFCITMET